MTGSAVPAGVPRPAREERMLCWCETLLQESWLTGDERALVLRVRSQILSPVRFFISDDREAALAELVGRIKPRGAIH